MTNINWRCVIQPVERKPVRQEPNLSTHERKLNLPFVKFQLTELLADWYKMSQTTYLQTEILHKDILNHQVSMLQNFFRS
jgi:hypothetical protein